MNYKGLTYLQYNWLLKLGYSDKSFNSQFLNIKNNIDVIIIGFDKSTKYDLRKASFDIQVLDHTNITWEDVLEYREIHYNASGRRTRSLNTFKEMYNWIINNNALLVFSIKNSKRVGVILVSFYNGLAYYGSAATLRDYDGMKGLGEFMQIAAIKYLKSKRVEYYELGHQYFYPDIIRLGVDEKAVSISKYKRKFGGETLPLFAGELVLSEAD
jgi:hypothetical protein